MYKITVVLCTYNSSIQKIYQSLYSILRQSMQDYEIIIADDGSTDFHAHNIEDFFRMNEFYNYKLLINDINQGTVHNIYNAIRISEGEYIFSIGPGDLVYNKYVFENLYNHANNKEEEIFIGDLRFYSIDKDKIVIHKNYTPNLPQLYNINHILYSIPRLLVFFQNNPVGVTYFWKRETILYYLNKIVGNIIYLEDKSTTLLYLFDGNKINYYDKPIVWYEYGTGISTSKNEYWKYLLDIDDNNLREMLLSRWPNSRILNTVFNKNNKIQNIDIYIIISIWKIYIKIKQHYTGIPKSEISELHTILDMIKE